MFKQIDLITHTLTQMISRLFKEPLRLVIAMVAIFGFMGAVLYGLQNIPRQALVSPIGYTQQVLGFGDILPTKQHMVYGFLPYWNFKYIDEIEFDHLTHAALFGLSFNPDGSIKTRESTYAEPGWRNLTSDQAVNLIAELKSKGIKPILTITAFDNPTMDAIFSSRENYRRVIRETLEFSQTYGYEGVNLDFEYVGTPTDTIRNNFTAFTDEFNQQAKAIDPDYHVSVDVYAESALSKRIWDLEALGKVSDHILIMAYDFHRPASTLSGPVAPLYGAGQGWSMDIAGLMAAHMRLNPPEKLIFGVPFYGYQWTTSTPEILSPTYRRSGGLATFREVDSILADTDVQSSVYWDNKSLTPWLVYPVGRQYQQIHYDNPQSMGYKLELVNQTNMAGIGIWALGYEGPSSWVWNTIESKLD